MIQRSITARLQAALNYSRIVFLSGPRQSGKSTLARNFTSTLYPAHYITLDDINARTAAQSDPIGFLGSIDPPIAIDEIQRAPDLLLEIKRLVDLNPQPGQFLLTGSTDLSAIRPAFDSLAGRIEEVELLPFAQNELHGSSRNFVDLLFQQEPPRSNKPLLERQILWDLLTTGGYPEPTKRSADKAKRQWFSAYASSIITRDIPELGQIRHSQALPKLLALCASQSGGLLNISDFARALQLPRASVDRYIQLLEALFIVNRLPTWHRNTGQRLVKAPKLYLVDSGLSAYLSKITAHAAAQNPSIIGPLLETFVYGELRKHRAWADHELELHHWRTAGGREVDFVLENQEGMVVGLEVKASATIRTKEAASLSALRDALGDQFQHGYILYSGSTVFRVAKRIYALPLTMLWQ